MKDIRSKKEGKPKGPMSEEHKKKLSEATKGRMGTSYWTGKKRSEETKKKISQIQVGRKHSLETRLRRANSHRGAKSHLWKGGITPINRALRNSLEYRIWREAVFKRDNYTCIWCGDNRGGNLNADHIKPFAYFPELRFAIDNGRTLCENCHKTTDTWGKKANKFRHM